MTLPMRSCSRSGVSCRASWPSSSGPIFPYLGLFGKGEHLVGNRAMCLLGRIGQKQSRSKIVRCRRSVKRLAGDGGNGRGVGVARWSGPAPSTEASKAFNFFRAAPEKPPAAISAPQPRQAPMTHFDQCTEVGIHTARRPQICRYLR